MSSLLSVLLRGYPRFAGRQLGGSLASQEEPEGLELARGIEPPTGGLQNHCSAIELRQPALLRGRTYDFIRGETVTTARKSVKEPYGQDGRMKCVSFGGLCD